MTPSWYRKKPVDIEAWQLTRNPDNAYEIVEWISSHDHRAVAVHKGEDNKMRYEEEYLQLSGLVNDQDVDPDAPPFLIIWTLEGAHRANPGDFIIKGVKGEFYPCREDIFIETYDLVKK